ERRDHPRLYLMVQRTIQSPTIQQQVEVARPERLGVWAQAHSMALHPMVLVPRGEEKSRQTSRQIRRPLAPSHRQVRTEARESKKVSTGEQAIRFLPREY